MKNKQIYYFLLAVTLIMGLNACTSDDNADEVEISNSFVSEKEEPILHYVSNDMGIIEMCESNDSKNDEIESLTQSEYAKAIAAYRRVLSEEQRVVIPQDSPQGASASFAVRGLGNARFALFDLTGDGIPELILDCAYLSFFETNADRSHWSRGGACVLTYKNGEVISLLISGSYDYAEILDNKMVLFYRKSGDASYMQYNYYTIDKSGTSTHIFDCSVPFNDFLETYSGDYAFRVNGDFVSQAEFEELTAPYFAIGYGLVGWTDLDTWLSEMKHDAPNPSSSDSVTSDLPDDVSTGWEDFMNNGLYTAEFSGAWEDRRVSYSEFDAAAQVDIDGDGATELVLRYVYPTHDYGDIEINDYAYIVLKNNNGYVATIASLWNMGGMQNHILRFNGNDLFVCTSRYAVLATRYEVSVLKNDELTELFSYTRHGDAENGGYYPITEENGVKMIDFWGDVEKYFGNNMSSSTPSINSYEELMAQINEVNSYEEIEFE